MIHEKNQLLIISNTEEVNVGLDEEAEEAFILQKVAAEAERQGAGDGGDFSKLFGDSEDEVEPEVEVWAIRWARITVVETLESKAKERARAQLSIPGLRATPTKKRTKAQSSKSLKFSAYVAKAGRKKQKASRP
ncbi:hypothetical protein ACFX15_046122 [Malus domestica]